MRPATQTHSFSRSCGFVPPSWNSPHESEQKQKLKHEQLCTQLANLFQRSLQ